MLAHDSRAADAVATPPATALDYFLIITGNELLTGIYPDRHTHFITGALQPRGAHCVGSLSVDDRAPDLTEALVYATQKAPLVIVTGGLGPTDDDITRETIARFAGLTLTESPEVLTVMERRFGQTRGELPPNLRRQCLIPARGGYLANPHGSAVGLVFATDKGAIVALPGPPRELQPMVQNELLPLLERRFGLRPPGCVRTLRFVGIGQSAIYQTLHERVPLEADVTLTSQFDGGRVDVTFSLAHDAPEEHARLDRLESQVRAVLGANLYAIDGVSLEDVVGRALKAKGAGLLIVDLATGGQLGSRLSGSSEGKQVVRAAIATDSEGALRQWVGAPADAAPTGIDAGGRWGAIATAAAGHLTARPLYVVVIGAPGRTSGDESKLALAFGELGKPLTVEEVGAGSASEQPRLITEILDRLRRRWQPPK